MPQQSIQASQKTINSQKYQQQYGQGYQSPVSGSQSLQQQANLKINEMSNYFTSLDTKIQDYQLQLNDIGSSQMGIHDELKGLSEQQVQFQHYLNKSRLHREHVEQQIGMQKVDLTQIHKIQAKSENIKSGVQSLQKEAIEKSLKNFERVSQTIQQRYAELNIQIAKRIKDEQKQKEYEEEQRKLRLIQEQQQQIELEAQRNKMKQEELRLQMEEAEQNIKIEAAKAAAEAERQKAAEAEATVAGEEPQEYQEGYEYQQDEQQAEYYDQNAYETQEYQQEDE